MFSPLQILPLWDGLKLTFLLAFDSRKATYFGLALQVLTNIHLEGLVYEAGSTSSSRLQMAKFDMTARATALWSRQVFVNHAA